MHSACLFFQIKLEDGQHNDFSNYSPARVVYDRLIRLFYIMAECRRRGSNARTAHFLAAKNRSMAGRNFVEVYDIY